MNVILDTNVLMSAIFWGGNPRKILDLWMEDRFRLVGSKEIVNEYEEIFLRLNQKYKTADSSILNAVLAHIWMMDASKLPDPVCEDSDDDKFLACALACALASSAKYIVTGDKLLLKVGKFHATEIAIVSKFLRAFS